MKPINLLIIVITLMHFSFIINHSIFDSAYTGIILMTNTILFLVAMITFATVKNRERKKQPA
ncbi:hypothetical protein KP77_08540 [Jeotgalibacillus alimentarius]|uniref:Uncharacterized protein n=1 Tax=Jeotgalibacillus alimentarius TaxID=135826 RepID=A0A0C2VQY9_9BACL|nr:hypothetical protein [Jeotgalibacillus alimentarius]KIL51342.1 hypothetical protein KP77_08540 [Jeotgalibacillus alimentarius]